MLQEGFINWIISWVSRLPVRPLQYISHSPTDEISCPRTRRTACPDHTAATEEQIERSGINGGTGSIRGGTGAVRGSMGAVRGGTGVVQGRTNNSILYQTHLVLISEADVLEENKLSCNQRTQLQTHFPLPVQPSRFERFYFHCEAEPVLWLVFKWGCSSTELLLTRNFESRKTCKNF